MRTALRYLASLLSRAEDDDQHLLEFALILALIVIVAVLSLVLLGDAIADLITLIGGRVDEGALVD